MHEPLPPKETFLNGMTVYYFYQNGKICVTREQFGFKEWAIWEKGSSNWMDEETFNQLF